MVVKGEGRDGQKKQWYSIHSHRSRLVIYKPEPDFYIYVVSRLSFASDQMLNRPQNITLSTHTGNRSQSLDGVQPPSTPSSALSSSSPTYQGTMGDPTTHAQGLSDRMIVDALSRGYQDFRVHCLIILHDDR